MDQPTDVTARTVSFDFSEVPLVVGFTEDRRPLAIALISGHCEIAASGLGKNTVWDPVAVSIMAPLLHYPDVPIRWVRECQTGRELWDWVSQSIIRSCTEEINELVAEGHAEADAKHDAGV